MEATLVFTGDIIHAFTHDGRGIRTRTLSNGSDCRLNNHTGDIIHAFTHDGRRIRSRTDAATSPSISMYVVLTYRATEASNKKGSSNSTIKGLQPSQYTPFTGVPIFFTYKFYEL